MVADVLSRIRAKRDRLESLVGGTARPGCRIYARRPLLCHDFSCQWIADGQLGPEWYPPIAGMVLVFVEPSTLFVVIDPDRPDLSLSEPYRSDLARMARWGQRSPTPFEVRVTMPATSWMATPAC
jgi:hypothetical protein